MVYMHLENSPSSNNRVDVTIENMSEHAALIASIHPNYLFRGFFLASKLSRNFGMQAEYPHSTSLTRRQLKFLGHQLRERVISEPATTRREYELSGQINAFIENTAQPPSAKVD